MANELNTQGVAATEPLAAEYEAPKVETVLTADDLAREIQYAGVSVQD